MRVTVSLSTLFAASLAGLILLPASAASAASFKEIRKWEVRCSSGLTCEASFSNWDNAGPRQISFKRSNAPGAPLNLVLALPDNWTDAGDKDGTYTISVDGTQVANLAVIDLKVDNSGAATGDPGLVNLVLAAMQAGKTLRLDYQGAFGTQKLDVDLSGLSGSLLYMDEAQDRLDRTDAIVRKGDRPAPEQAMVIDITSIDEIPATIRGDFTNPDAACGGIDPASFGYLGAYSVSMGSARTLVLPCGLGGAYNQPYALYIGYGDALERTSFPDMRDGGPSVASAAYNVDYYYKTKTLTAFFKGRGVGDCGMYSVWSLTGGEDESPGIVLKELRNKDDCDEKDMGEPEKFPLVWPKP